MKIYEENQFTKNVRGQEDLEDKSYDSVFAKQVIKCIEGPSRARGDKVLKADEDFDDNRGIAEVNGQFKTIIGSTYKYSGKISMKKTSDGKEDISGDMTAAFVIHSAVPYKDVKKYNVNVKKIEEIVKKFIAGKDNNMSVKEVTISNCVCEISYDKVCGGDCKIKIHSVEK